MSEVHEKLSAFSEQRSALQHRGHQLLAQQEAHERRAEEARAEAREARQAAVATALVPGQEEGDPEALARAEELEAEAERLLNEREEVQARVAEVNEREQAWVRDHIPDAVQRVEDATAKVRDRFARIGKEVLIRYPSFLEAKEERKEALSDLNNLLARYRAPDGSGGRAQRRNLKGYLRQGRTGATAEEIVGFLVVDLLRWLRLGSSPLEGYWEEQGVERLEGSVLYEPPVRAREEIVAKLRQGELPF